MITPKTPPGFNEFLPKEQLAFNAMLSSIRSTYEQHGFTPLETPALELAQVLLAKEGGETAKQVYRFMKGDTDLALRFDLTVPLARYVAEHYHELAFPFRRYQIQEVWRAEKSQAGRYRQFYQCDVDIVGQTGPTADAEVILAAYQAYKALGLKNIVFRISHRGLLSGYLESQGLSKHIIEVLRIIDKLDKKPAKIIVDDLVGLGIKKNTATDILKFVSLTGTPKEVLNSLSQLSIDRSDFKAACLNLQEITVLLAAGGMKSAETLIDLKITRGFDYYTGVVFEMFLENQEGGGSVGAGGRYDNLVGHYRKEALPGVGASIGVSRLFSLLPPTKHASTPAQALVVVFNEKLLPYCFKVATTLRSAGLNSIIYPGIDKAGKQLSYADKLGIPFVILCGEDEEKKNKVTIKNMKSGKQKTLPLTKATKELRKI